MTQATSERTDRQVDVRTPAGETSGSVTLPGELFDATANVSLMHQVVVAQLAAARQGTHATKTRGQVSGGGAKPYRQKGTGRARQGSTRAPQFTGGGTVHGPQPRDYTQRTPKKMKAAALRGALSDRAREDRVHVVTGFVDGWLRLPPLARGFALVVTLTAAGVLVLRLGAARRLPSSSATPSQYSQLKAALQRACDNHSAPRRWPAVAAPVTSRRASMDPSSTSRISITTPPGSPRRAATACLPNRRSPSSMLLPEG